MCNSKHISHTTQNMKKICLIWQPIFSHKIFALCCWNSFFYIMYLMYYLNEDGKRVYTLKVRKLYIIVIFVSMSLVCSSVLSRLFFSLLEHTITLISIENSSRNSPRRPLSFPYVLNRKRVRMGNRRCRRTRRDSRRTISSLNRESRAKNGSGYFSRSNRRNSFKSSKIWIRDWISREEREKET